MTPARLTKELDKYYTKEHIAIRCIESITLGDYDLIIEPSAGSGNFLKHLYHNIDTNISSNIIGMDLYPENSGILQQDWSTYTIDHHYDSVLIIGNPPFGVNHIKSDMFIQHALQFTNVKTIAFILPNTYKKHTRQRILPKEWRIKEIVDIERNAFTFNHQERHVPCSFFIFDKSHGKDLRVDPNKYKDTKHFVFGNKHCFDLFVFGAAPQRVTYNPSPNNRGYFLKTKPGYDRNFVAKKIQSTEWKGNSCANGGVFWLTKYEFLAQYNNAWSYDK